MKSVRKVLHSAVLLLLCLTMVLTGTALADYGYSYWGEWGDFEKEPIVEARYAIVQNEEELAGLIHTGTRIATNEDLWDDGVGVTRTYEFTVTQDGRMILALFSGGLVRLSLFSADAPENVIFTAESVQGTNDAFSRVDLKAGVYRYRIEKIRDMGGTCRATAALYLGFMPGYGAENGAPYASAHYDSNVPLLKTDDHVREVRVKSFDTRGDFLLEVGEQMATSEMVKGPRTRDTFVEYTSFTVEESGYLLIYSESLAYGRLELYNDRTRTSLIAMFDCDTDHDPEENIREIYLDAGTYFYTNYDMDAPAGFWNWLGFLPAGKALTVANVTGPGAAGDAVIRVETAEDYIGPGNNTLRLVPQKLTARTVNHPELMPKDGEEFSVYRGIMTAKANGNYTAVISGEAGRTYLAEVRVDILPNETRAEETVENGEQQILLMNSAAAQNRLNVDLPAGKWSVKDTVRMYKEALDAFGIIVPQITAELPMAAQEEAQEDYVPFVTLEPAPTVYPTPMPTATTIYAETAQEDYVPFVTLAPTPVPTVEPTPMPAAETEEEGMTMAQMIDRIYFMQQIAGDNGVTLPELKTDQRLTDYMELLERLLRLNGFDF